MADAEDGEREVLTSLPRSRPVRRSAKRGDRPRPDGADAAPAATATKPAAPRKSASASASPARKPPAAKVKRPAGASASGASAKAAGTTPKPKAAAKPRTRPTVDPKTKPRVAPERKVPPAGYASASKADSDDAPGATEILTSALQAATELAQIGISVGRQALQSAFERLPKP